MSLSRTSRVFFSLSVVLVTLLVRQPSHAEMAPSLSVKLADVVSHVEGLRKKRKLSETESEILLLAKLGRDAAKVTSIELDDYGLDSGQALASVLKLTPSDFASKLSGRIGLEGTWQVQGDALQYLKQNQDRLRSYFTTDQAASAWFLFQTGETEKARSSLVKAFERNYTFVMKLEQQSDFGSNEIILRQGWIVKGIETMSPKAESEKFNEKLRKMKIHYSKLPESDIVT